MTYVNRLLDFIAGPESGGSYQATYGHKGDRDFSRMTLNQVIADASRRGKKYGSGATGRYQFMPATLRDLKKSQGLTGSELFTPQLQDYLGTALLERRGLNRYLAGEMAPETFARNLSKEWAGLPKGPGGESYYKGVMGNKAGVQWNDLMSAVHGNFQLQHDPLTGRSQSPQSPDWKPIVHKADFMGNPQQQQVPGLLAGESTPPTFTDEQIAQMTGQPVQQGDWVSAVAPMLYGIGGMFRPGGMNPTDIAMMRMLGQPAQQARSPKFGVANVTKDGREYTMITKDGLPYQQYASTPVTAQDLPSDIRTLDEIEKRFPGMSTEQKLRMVFGKDAPGAAQEEEEAPSYAEQTARLNTLERIFRNESSRASDMQVYWGNVRDFNPTDMTGAMDFTLIANFAKMNDPESIMTEGEGDAIRKAASKSTVVDDYYKRYIQGGNQLEKNDRRELIKEMERLAYKAYPDAKKAWQDSMNRAKASKLDPSLLPQVDMPEWKPYANSEWLKPVTGEGAPTQILKERAGGVAKRTGQRLVEEVQQVGQTVTDALSPGPPAAGVLSPTPGFVQPPPASQMGGPAAAQPAVGGLGAPPVSHPQIAPVETPARQFWLEGLQL